MLSLYIWRIRNQGGRGHWTGNYTGTQSFINIFSHLFGYYYYIWHKLFFRRVIMFTIMGLGEILLFITIVPKVLLFVGSTTIGTFIEFWLVGSFSWFRLLKGLTPIINLQLGKFSLSSLGMYIILSAIVLSLYIPG